MLLGSRPLPFAPLLLLALLSPYRAHAHPGQRLSSPASASASEDLPDAPSAWLQQPATPLPAPPPPDETEAQRKARLHAQGDREVKVEETQRIAVVVPNFNTVISGRAVPLSPGQKTDLALHAAFDPFNFVGAAFNTGVSELNGSHRGFGWGPAGAAKRYGANIADVLDGTMLAGAVYPILLRAGPPLLPPGHRQPPLPRPPRPARLRHLPRRQRRKQPNFSNVLGNFTAGLISNAYYPSDETGIGLSLVNSTIQTAEGAAGNIALEFSPDVEAWFRRRKERRSQPHASVPAPQTATPPATP